MYYNRGFTVVKLFIICHHCILLFFVRMFVICFDIFLVEITGAKLEPDWVQ